MSEEEKQAIEDLKSALRYKGEHIYFLDIDFVAIETVLNLIEKQQKEIEELKIITREYETYKCGEGNKIVIATKEYFINGFFEDFLNGYISKDKIRELIENNIEDIDYSVHDIIKDLKELLEEENDENTKDE